jgi:hypothetical protein
MVHQGISRRVLRGATYDPGHWTFYFCRRGICSLNAGGALPCERSRVRLPVSTSIYCVSEPICVSLRLFLVVLWCTWDVIHRFTSGKYKRQGLNRVLCGKVREKCGRSALAWLIRAGAGKPKSLFVHWGMFITLSRTLTQGNSLEAWMLSFYSSLAAFRSVCFCNNWCGEFLQLLKPGSQNPFVEARFRAC